MESLPFSSPDEFPTPRNLSAIVSGLNDRQAHGQYHKNALPVTVMTCGSRILSACAVLALNGNFCVVQPNTVCRTSHHLGPTGIIEGADSVLKDRALDHTEGFDRTNGHARA